MAKFEPGQTGNPRGRPRKPRTGPDTLRANLLSEAPAILAALVEQAKTGDPAAARLVLDRCLPALKPQDQAVPVALGTDLTQASTAVLAALATGALTPDQADSLAGVLSALVRVREATELEQRITKLEESANGNS